MIAISFALDEARLSEIKPFTHSNCYQREVVVLVPSVHRAVRVGC